MRKREKKSLWEEGRKTEQEKEAEKERPIEGGK